MIVRALAYTQVMSILVPVMSGLSALGPAGSGMALPIAIWVTAVQVIAIAKMQGIGTGKAAMAFLVWVAIGGCLACVAGGALFLLNDSGVVAAAACLLYPTAALLTRRRSGPFPSSA